MKKIAVIISVIAAVFSAALFFSSDSSAVNISENSEFYSYLLECANSYQKEIDEIIRQAQLAASGTVVYDDGDWRWPLDSKFTMITTYFGYSEFHSGNHGFPRRKSI